MLYTIRNRTKTLTTEELICSLCFAFLIPAITGIVSATDAKNNLFFYYTAFALITFGLWRLNKYIFSYLKTKINFEREYSNKRYWLLTSVFLFSSLATIFFLFLWNHYVQPVRNDWKSFIDSFILLVGFSIVVTLFEENNLLTRRKQKEVFKNQKAERLKVEAELESLKNQIDPHFLFNSLNTMSFLIESDQVKAKLFNDTLADVYQYILVNKKKNLISLKKELEFAKNYFRLVSIRYSEGIKLNIRINTKDDNFFLPPISIQTLLENAIKHNSFSKEYPLSIEIAVEDRYVFVKNNLQKTCYLVKGSKLGLENLSARYELISNKRISVDHNRNYFSVKLPLLNTSYNV